MFKKTLSTALLVICYELLVMSCFAQEEKLTITTYYPSPYGSYNQLYVADKLGIGTTSPQTQLHIRGDGAYISLNDDVTAGGSPETAAFSIAADNGSGRLITDKNLDIYIDSDNNDADTRHFSIIKNQGWGGPLATTIFTVSESGNVGIGTASPGTKLHILGQSPALRIDDVSDPNNPDGTRFMDWDIVATHSGNTGRLDIRRGGGGVNVMSILETTSGGNVGIGTTTPNSKLSIGENGAAGREYLKIDMESGDPPADECNEQPEGGRMIYDDAGHVIWACDGAGGWKRLGGGSQYVYINPALVFARGICNATIYAFAGASYTNNSLFPINQYVTVNYPAVIPTSATAIIVKFYAQADEDTTWISVRADHFPEDFIANAVAYNNDDDAASDTNTITMPYEANRQMQIRWYNTYNDIDNDIGVRAYVVGYIQ